MIQRYVWKIIVPYFLLSWLLLTVLLFFQQGGRFTEILFSSQIPFPLLLKLAAALFVSVIAFTGPMALLTGIVIGLSQMRGDSELTALQAAGIGQRQVLQPCAVLGIVVSVIALLINFYGVPQAAAALRKIAVEAALIKLAAPIEPGVFNTDFNNYVIYVRSGDLAEGVWENVFLYLPERSGQIKIITARTGRIDAASDQSELVLRDSIVTTLPQSAEKPQPIAVDNVGSLRISLDIGQQQVREQLAKIEKTPEEMGLAELASVIEQKTGRDKTEAQILLYRRLALSIAPFLMSLLGVALSVNHTRGGRGWGSLVSLGVLVIYYLISLLGEQLVRNNSVPALIGCSAASVIVLLTSFSWLSLARKRIISGARFSFGRFGFFNFLHGSRRSSTAVSLSSFSRWGWFGLLERDLLRNLLWYFAAICGALLILFHVFTAFEVLRGINGANGWFLLAKYLFFLTPLVLWQIAPSALMIAVLITFTIKVRSREFAVWGAAGQSVYTLIAPSLLLAVGLGFISWQWQEKVLPVSNPKQDQLRAQLKGGGIVGRQEGKFWVAAAAGIYSFKAVKASENEKVSDISFYQFGSDSPHLQKLLIAAQGEWEALPNNVVFAGGVREIAWNKSYVADRQLTSLSMAANENPFNLVSYKPNEISSETLQGLLAATDSAAEKQRLTVALNRKQATFFLPLVLVFFSAPLALSLRPRREGSGRPLAVSILVWLLLMGTVSLFDKLGTEGVLPAAIAVWAPLILFSSVGWFLLSRIR